MNRHIHFSIVFDTNALQEGVGRDFSHNWACKAPEYCSAVIESMDAYEYFNILIPELVLAEISQHQMEGHKAHVEVLKSTKLPAWEFDYDSAGYSGWLKESHDHLREKAKIGMVPLRFISVSDEDGLGRIIKRVLRKAPPFSCAKGESDKGFKDAVIWESVLEYKEAHPNEQIILVSKDKLMTCDRIRKEYEDRFGEELIIASNGLTDLCETLKSLIEPLELGYATPGFIGDEANLIQLIKNWIFMHMSEIEDFLDMPFESNNKTKIERIDANWISDEDCEVSIVLRMGKDDLSEARIVSLVFLVSRDSEQEAWLLKTLSIDGECEIRDELLDVD